jgi:FKBP-type peptidyl-prolyl cis-trans isomerase FklB
MVPSMKQTTVGSCGRTFSAWLLMAAAPLAGAQNPSPAPTAPTAPAAPTAPIAPSAPTAPTAPAAPSSDQTSYLFGLTFGEQMHHVGITNEISLNAMTRGLQDGLQGKKTTSADQQQLNAFVRTVMESAIARNQAAAKDFLAHNAHEKGVVTRTSGLQYKVLVPGDRKAPPIVATDEVAVQYRGTLLDGTEFDSTYSRPGPMTFVVNGVIPGWQEALVLMKPGAKWQIFVPPELGYGATPQRGIPGGSLLIFEVELLSVKENNLPAAPPGTPGVKPAPASKQP